jgi:hypothetical protein
MKRKWNECALLSWRARSLGSRVRIPVDTWMRSVVLCTRRHCDRPIHPPEMSHNILNRFTVSEVTSEYQQVATSTKTEAEEYWNKWQVTPWKFVSAHSFMKCFYNWSHTYHDRLESQESIEHLPPKMMLRLNQSMQAAFSVLLWRTDCWPHQGLGTTITT